MLAPTPLHNASRWGKHTACIRVKLYSSSAELKALANSLTLEECKAQLAKLKAEVSAFFPLSASLCDALRTLGALTTPSLPTLAPAELGGGGAARGPPLRDSPRDSRGEGEVRSPPSPQARASQGPARSGSIA